jgi:putative ABC transport system substrate-binding protein
MINRYLLKYWLWLGLIFSSQLLANDTAQAPYVIGISSWANYPESIKGFKLGLKESGLTEGKEITFIERSASATLQRQQAIAEEFKLSQVDLVYSLTTPGTIIIKEVMPTETPIVFSIVTYPADAGLIESYEYSGNNLVGTSNYIGHNHLVNLINSIMPTIKTVAIFRRTGEPNSKLQVVSLIRKLKRKNIQVLDIEAKSIAQLKSLAAPLDKVEAFITTTDTLMQGGGEDILIEIAKQLNIPVISSNKKGIEKGAAFGPVADFNLLGRMSGIMAAKILTTSIKPFDLSTQQMPAPLIIINREAIARLNLKIPNSLKKAIYVD